MLPGDQKRQYPGRLNVAASAHLNPARFGRRNPRRVQCFRHTRGAPRFSHVSLPDQVVSVTKLTDWINTVQRLPCEHLVPKMSSFGRPLCAGLRSAIALRGMTEKSNAINKTARRANLLIYRKSVKPQNKKYFAFTEIKIRAHLSPSRPNNRGVGHVTNVGRVAVDVEVP